MAGPRIHEVRPMRIVGDIIVIKGKGGRMRKLDFSFRRTQLAEIQDLQSRLTVLSKGVNWKKYCQCKDSIYHGHVRAACRSLGEHYAGAHGFRAVHAQELDKLLAEMGWDVSRREHFITQELGHNRISMAKHYLSI